MKDGISPRWYVDIVPSTWHDGMHTPSNVEHDVSSTWDDDVTPILEDGVTSQFNCIVECKSLIHSLCLSNSKSLFVSLGG